MDYGYFEAMTPTATSGAIQDGRDRQRSRQLQLAQQQQAIETADLNKLAQNTFWMGRNSKYIKRA